MAQDRPARCDSLVDGPARVGKSTVAVVLERLLVSRGRVAYLIDGDNIRHGISDDLGFSRVTARRTSAASGTWRDCSPTPA